MRKINWKTYAGGIWTNTWPFLEVLEDQRLQTDSAGIPPSEGNKGRVNNRTKQTNIPLKLYSVVQELSDSDANLACGLPLSMCASVTGSQTVSPMGAKAPSSETHQIGVKIFNISLAPISMTGLALFSQFLEANSQSYQLSASQSFIMAPLR